MVARVSALENEGAADGPLCPHVEEPSGGERSQRTGLAASREPGQADPSTVCSRVCFRGSDGSCMNLARCRSGGPGAQPARSGDAAPALAIICRNQYGEVFPEGAQPGPHKMGKDAIGAPCAH